MSGIRYQPDQKGIGEASRVAMKTRAARATAKRVLAEAKRLARQAGLDAFADSLTIDATPRPKGRGQIRIIADTPDAEKVEFGDSATARHRILGRAAGR